MKQILKYSLVVLVLFACKRDKVDSIGPSYISAPDGFFVANFTATPNPVNFNTGLKSVSFYADFTAPVSWTLTIVGQRSGAVRVLRGISQGLPFVVWNGNHDGVIFFKSNELATATLSFFGTEYTASTVFKITGAPNFTSCGHFPSFGDFESPSFIKHANGWHAFNDRTPNPPIPNVEQGPDSAQIAYNGDLVKAVQGKYFYYIRGKGEQQVFVSGIQFDGGMSGGPLPADADQVYGTGDPNAGVELEYQEADGDEPNDIYNGATDDAFTAKFTLDHKGWKLFSFKYSTLTPSLNALFGGSGNHVHEPDKLKSFDLVLVKKLSPDSPIEVYFDYPIITVGGPFKPCR